MLQKVVTASANETVAHYRQYNKPFVAPKLPPTLPYGPTTYAYKACDNNPDTVKYMQLIWHLDTRED